MILADHAVADPAGKVHMLGAGWSLTVTPTPPQAVVLLLKIPWDRTNQRIPLSLQLVDEDGRPVQLTTAEGKTTTIETGAQVEVGRPAGVPPGSMIDTSLAINVQPMPLAPGRYRWQLDIANGEDTRSVGFMVRSA